ncbi:hypothetical protein ASPWEDRAFT_22788 [Aspergillus wentii DTO 134E9]|uniref:Uncharacterized protein n=1 Tax=Aspergillus wentii DTO 134E9 TaxID=1073089 RepID=A0A1L9S0G0_ASPWE|nr:uncharacterized protein ASPWEDRAFT_22788 [Aspergillus wentii DTO 134E9]OJJ40623.1 hypothetical protein ASPWEDRAFT_22788 [Aspergillus wentii DTO 134E9]
MSCATGNQRTTIASRPKLTLQTSSLPQTFGKSTTGLSLSFAAGATASPTVRNTFKNAYDVAHPPSATVSPSRASSNKFCKPSSPYTTTNSPYQLPLGVRSILRNSPLEPSSRRRSGSVATNVANGGSTQRRVLFPAKKQVSYRQPLEEEIRTVRYTARHSDIVAEPPKPREERSDEDSDTNSSLAPSDTSSSDDDAGTKSSLSKLERKKRKNMSAEKQIRAVALLDGLEGDSYGSSTPQTPRQGRVKRRCEWRWTLGPLEKRDELISLPQTPLGTTPTISTPPVNQETKGTEKETPVSFHGDSDFAPSPNPSQDPSSPGSSVASNLGNPDETKTNMTHEAERANEGR